MQRRLVVACALVFLCKPEGESTFAPDDGRDWFNGLPQFPVIYCDISSLFPATLEYENLPDGLRVGLLDGTTRSRFCGAVHADPCPSQGRWYRGGVIEYV